MTSLTAAEELIKQIQSLKEHCDDQAYEKFRAAAMAQINPLAAAIDIASKPLEVSVAVLGVFRGGKSTLLNALLGARLLPAALAPTTATVTEIAYRPGEFLMEARYVAEGDASYQTACEALERLLHETPADRVLEVFRDPHNRASVEALLGMYGRAGATWTHSGSCALAAVRNISPSRCSARTSATRSPWNERGVARDQSRPLRASSATLRDVCGSRWSLRS